MLPSPPPVGAVVVGTSEVVSPVLAPELSDADAVIVEDSDAVFQAAVTIS